MTRSIPFLILILTACSAPRYSYHFDRYTPTLRPHANAKPGGDQLDRSTEVHTPTAPFHDTGHKRDTPQKNETSQKHDSPQKRDSSQKYSTSQRPESPLTFDARGLTATTRPSEPQNDFVSSIQTTTRTQPATSAETRTSGVTGTSAEPAVSSQRPEKHFTRAQRRELIESLKQFRREMLQHDIQKLNDTPADQATQKLDNEVIVAIAFGAVGITLSLLGGISAAFWIAGVICLGVGVYFFFDWLSRRQ